MIHEWLRKRASRRERQIEAGRQVRRVFAAEMGGTSEGGPYYEYLARSERQAETPVRAEKLS
jgi:hypothetical protein